MHPSLTADTNAILPCGLISHSETDSYENHLKLSVILFLSTCVDSSVADYDYTDDCKSRESIVKAGCMLLYTTWMSCIWYIISFSCFWWHGLLLHVTGKSWAPAPKLCLLTLWFVALPVQPSFGLTLSEYVMYYRDWLEEPSALIQYKNIILPAYELHERDTTVISHSYFNNWSSYTVKTASLYLISPKLHE